MYKLPILMNKHVLVGQNENILPHSALSCNFSLTENLASLSFQDWDTTWYYFPAKPPTHPPPDQMDLYIGISRHPMV